MLLLDKNRYHQVLQPLKHVGVNHLFALSVVEKHITGFVYVDHQERPVTFYVLHPYGMSLLFGSTENTAFNRSLLDYLLNTSGVRNTSEWLQAYPYAWNHKLTDLLGDYLVKYNNESDNKSFDKIVENTRVNFKFNTNKYLEFKNDLGLCKYNVRRTDSELFRKMQGTVVPKFFWDSADDFCKHGVGYCLVLGEKPVSTAYSAYITDKQLELGIETSEEYRGEGFALYTCSALIDYCLEYHYEPVWSCRFENTGSYRLAQRLGFEPTITLPFYKIP
jgi:hypothetical protein